MFSLPSLWYFTFEKLCELERLNVLELVARTEELVPLYLKGQ